MHETQENEHKWNKSLLFYLAILNYNRFQVYSMSEIKHLRCAYET